MITITIIVCVIYLMIRAAMLWWAYTSFIDEDSFNDDAN
jgi:hypothetical protein